MSTGPQQRVAVLAGTDRQPEVRLYFDRDDRHASSGESLVEWVKRAPNRHWDRVNNCWVITAFGGTDYKPRDPDRVLAKAGFVVEMNPAGLDPSLRDVISLSDLTAPMVRQSKEKPAVALVRMRFAGWEVCRNILGLSAKWDRENQRFEVPIAEILTHGDPKHGLLIDPATVAAAREAISAKPAFGHAVHDDETLLADAAALALSTGMNLSEADEEQIARLAEVVGDVPDWFGLNLYPYQRLGAIAANAGRGAICDPTGLGKGSPDWVKILTPTGWTTYGDIALGDQVVGSDGKPCTVIGVYPRGELDVFKVTFSDGSSVVVDGDHLWSVNSIEGRWDNWHPKTLSTRQIMEQGLTDKRAKQNRHLHFIPIVEPVQFDQPDEPLPIDPYLLGVLLGDGAFGGASVCLTVEDPQIADEVARRLPDEVTLVPRKKTTKAQNYGFPGTAGRWQPNPLTAALRDLGLMGHRAWEKFIPQRYLLGTVEERLELLRGLADTDGTVGVAPDIVTTSPQLAEDIKFLVQSLGGIARMSTKTPTYKHRDGTKRQGRLAYRIGMNMPVDKNPFRLARKAEAWKAPWKYAPMRSIRSIEPAGRENVTCIAVDAPDALYVTEDFIVTHNTRQGIAALAIRNVDRAVVIVPPVVMTSWKNEILESGLAVEKPKPLTKAQIKALAKAEKEKAAETSKAAAPTAKEKAAACESETDRGRDVPLAPPRSVGPDLSSASSVTDGAPTGETSHAETPRYLALFKAGRKEPDLPERGIVVVPDSLLASRPALRAAIAKWNPDGLVYDEAHRARTWRSTRAEAIRDLCDRMRPDALRIPMTATPLFSNPAELASPLAISGHLARIFGGYDAFMARYTKRNHFNAPVANLERLPELRQILAEQVWVRRKKLEVLKDLPPKARYGKYVDVDLTGFRAAHDEVIEAILLWLDAWIESEGDYPNDDDIRTFSRQSIGLMSPLRRAAGMAKVPVALDLIAEWLANEVQINADGTATTDRPLVIWAHHHEVIEAMVAHAAAHLKEGTQRLVGVIAGNTSADKRGHYVAEFQAGRLPVLICSITAAGVGITLTRGSDALFVETSYSVPEVSQAEDRQWRIGQESPISCTTLIAEGTLDPHIQRILIRKAEIIDAVTGDDSGVAVMTEADLDDKAAPSEIVEALVHHAVEKHRKGIRAVAAVAA